MAKGVLKSIRIPEDILEMIEAQPGENFTAKFENLVRRCVQELPQKEFLLLYKLLSYPGKIFTRIQLMDEIWGADSDTGWETVTVHIGRLRKRFADNPEFEIVSVRGLGYKAVKKV